MPVNLDSAYVLKTIDGRPLIVQEKTTWQLSAMLIDEADLPVPLAGFSTLTVTLYNRDSVAQEIINGVQAVNILNVGRGVLHPTSGLLTVTFEPSDNLIVDPAKPVEWHRLVIEGTYGLAGGKTLRIPKDFGVMNLEKVT